MAEKKDKAQDQEKEAEQVKPEPEKEAEQEKDQDKPKAPELIYKYTCPKCGKVAIKTSNKMIGVMVNCIACGELIKLESLANYKKI